MRGPMLLLFLLALAAGQDAAPHTEPPRLYSLEIDGHAHQLVGGRTHELEIHGRKTAVKLTPLPYRELETASFSFRFPAGATYKYDDGADFEKQPSWTVSRPTCFIELTRTNAASQTAAVDQWAAVVAKAGTTRKKAKLKLGSLELDGVRMDYVPEPDMASRSLIFAFMDNAGAIWVVQVYDSPDEKGGMSAELRPMLEMFKKTFALRG